MIYFVIINITTFLLMGLDKAKAKKNRWRIPEKFLFLTAFLGGAIGGWIGMYTFRHKTRHWYFVVGMAVLSVAEFLSIILLYKSVLPTIP